MTEPFFFRSGVSLSVRELIAETGAEPLAGRRVDLDRRIEGIAALDFAGPGDLTFFDNGRYRDDLATTRAGVCLTSDRFESEMPTGLLALRVKQPYRSFVTIARKLYAGSLRPSSLFEAPGISSGALVNSNARLENGVTVDPGAVVGPRAEIGLGTVIGAGAAIGPGVRIGRHCSIGANVTLSNAIVGDRVIIHPGCNIGQDGFGFANEPNRHVKVPQIGRVIIQNDVEIGAGTAVDRGAIRDTVIGEGTKIDNLVQIGHNVSIGRHCVIVAQSGISGSVTLRDFVVLGGRVSVNNHVTIGEGAQIAATSAVKDDVPPGARWGGVPAKPAKDWFREMVALERLAVRTHNGDAADGRGGAKDRSGSEE